MYGVLFFFRNHWLYIELVEEHVYRLVSVYTSHTCLERNSHVFYEFYVILLMLLKFFFMVGEVALNLLSYEPWVSTINALLVLLVDMKYVGS